MRAEKRGDCLGELGGAGMWFGRLTRDDWMGRGGCAEDGRVRDPPPFGKLRAGSTQEDAEDSGMTGMCR